MSDHGYILIDFTPPPGLWPDRDRVVRFTAYVRGNFGRIVSGVPAGCELDLFASGHAHNPGAVPLLGLWTPTVAPGPVPDADRMIEEVSRWCSGLSEADVENIVATTAAPTWEELVRTDVYPARRQARTNVEIPPPLTPLLAALGGGDRATALALIAAGADPNAADLRFLFGQGMTPLHFAALSGDSELVRTLIIAGANVNARDRSGHTPLWFACNGGCVEAAREILAAGADPNIRCAEGYSPLGRVQASDPVLVDLIRRHGGQV